jgi:phosphoenolpyruvate synthase/pyruvate phosphate dikinase
MEFIKDFKNLSKYDAAIAGGKGASLGEMTQDGILVPSGFVILSTAFERFLEETDLNVEIDSILHSVDQKEMRTVENASEKIKTLIFGAEMPKSIAEEIQKFFKELNEKYVAIRSSATVEDSASASWAGQLESYLNVTEKNILENVKKCWASLYTPSAIFYRFEKGLWKQKISVAVVVQKMVDSEISGIAFSVHPVTQDPNQLIIEAGFGLGDKIVSGQITPDAYVVNKSTWDILDKNIADHNNQKLNDSEIIKLAKLITKIENHFGFPVDIEWAKEKNKFYITQSRPITTLHNITENKQSIFDYIKSQKWFFGVRADESLLFYSVKRNGYIKYINKEYGIDFAETLLIPLKKNYPIRVFNHWQAESFHAISNKKILKNPKILISYIKKSDLLFQDIKIFGKKLILVTKENNYRKSAGLFNKILGLYEIASAQFIIIFSLGLKLAENKDKLKNVEGVIKKHDIWRNSMAFKEEAMGENLFYFFKFLTKRKKLKLAPLLLMRFLTLNEVEAWLNEKLTDAEIKNIIKSRKDRGFIYLNLRNENREVIDDLAKITKIQKYFLKLDKESKKQKNNNEITGQVAYSSSKTLRGRVIVIKDKSELKNKNYLIDDKVLVAIQTTPHYIPYVRNAKAIITDEGGLTCHAAIIAREFKIPCIVGTKTATQILKDNDSVEIDTNKGAVKINK